MNLPTFKYHPDPAANGVIEKSPEKCACCGEARGYIYLGPVYPAKYEDAFLCPWCVADGSAAKKWNARFTNKMTGPARKEPDESIREEVLRRTPSYIAYQDPMWLHHCGEGCAYIGEAEAEDLEDLHSDVEHWFLDTNEIDVDQWAEIKETYEQGGDPAIHKFSCLKCGATLLHIEWA